MDAINQYVYRGQKPKPMPAPKPKKISTPAGQRLSTILESNNAGVPSNANISSNSSSRTGFGLTNLSFTRSEQHGVPPRASEEKRPPSYDSESNVHPALRQQQDGMATPHLRTSMARGGWGRLILIVLLVIAILGVALGVGLGVGLRKNGSGNTAPTSTPSESPSSPLPFPIGAYAITAFLTNTSTSCTSNASTWSCYPYTTYSSDPTGSEAPFNWIITAAAADNTFQISSSDNPLSLAFANASLTLLDADSPTERYTFSVPNIVKTVLPSVSLTNDNVRSTCFYNSTVLHASLYTRMNATLLGDLTIPQAQMGRGVNFNQTWPGAVMVEQTAAGGSEVPNCYRLSNGWAVGDMLPLPTEPHNTQCSCLYRNYAI